MSVGDVNKEREEELEFKIHKENALMEKQKKNIKTLSNLTSSCRSGKGALKNREKGT